MDRALTMGLRRRPSIEVTNKVIKFLAGKCTGVSEGALCLLGIAGLTSSELEAGRADLMLVGLNIVDKFAGAMKLHITGDGRALADCFLVIAGDIGAAGRDTAINTFLILTAFALEGVAAARRVLALGGGTLISLRSWQDDFSTKGAQFLSEAGCNRIHPYLFEELQEVRRKEKGKAKASAPGGGRWGQEK